MIYLIRIPYDVLAVNVRIDGKLVAILPRSSYTALDIEAKPQTLTTSAKDDTSTEWQVAPPLLLNLRPGERTLLYLSGSTDQSKSNISISMVGGLPFATGPVSSRLIMGGWVWKEANEVDAQGLMSIAKVKLPE